MVKVKVCGITNLNDALKAVDAGADALGFIMYKNSKRYIPPKEVRKITKELPPFVTKVGVFVNEKQTSVLEILSYANLDFSQLHGDETPEYCKYIGVNRVIKVFRLKSEAEIENIKDYEPFMKAVLFDTFSKEFYGGTGKTFDWSMAERVKETLSVPVILSGGLNIDNVKKAVEKLKPYAVDVCSGVEIEPGIKDISLVKKFIRLSKCSDCDA